MFQLPGAPLGNLKDFKIFRWGEHKTFKSAFFQTAQNQVVHNDLQNFPVSVNRNLVT